MVVDKPKEGVYQTPSGITGCCVVKSMKPRQYGFMVSCYAGSSWDQNKVSIWCADLVPKGRHFEEDDEKRHPAWSLSGHPDRHMFVSVGHDLVQYTHGFAERVHTWTYKGTIDENNKTFMREPAGKPILKYPTDNYIEAVHHKDPSCNEVFSPDTNTIIKACCHCDEIPTDPKERQAFLAKMYTIESPLYHEMNTALREDNLLKLKYFGAYIKELCDVFKTDHEDQIIEPFEGTLWRGIHFEDPETELEHFKEGSKFSWPAFTSMTTDQSVAMGFGNVTFQIVCKPPKGMYDDDKAEYAPASVSKWSDFPSESEILFPPNTAFIVKEVVPAGDENPNPLIKCETIAFSTDAGQEQFKSTKALYLEMDDECGE